MCTPCKSQFAAMHRGYPNHLVLARPERKVHTATARSDQSAHTNMLSRILNVTTREFGAQAYTTKLTEFDDDAYGA